MSLRRNLICTLLPNREKEYCPGETLSGVIVFQNYKPYKVREIRLVLEGNKRTEWEERSVVRLKDGSLAETIWKVTGHRRFLYKKITVAGKGIYPPDDRRYPFSVQLPDVLPSSYNGTYGTVNYSIISTVDVPFALNLEYRQYFKVKSVIDLNQIPWLNPGPVSYIVNKTLRWWFSSLGTITMKVELEKAALAPGEGTNITIDLQNSSSVEVVGVEAQITRYTLTYFNNKISRPIKEKDILTRAVRPGVIPQDNWTYHVLLTIPATTRVPNLRGCDLFKQWTQLEVNAVISGFHGELKLIIPIKLGNIQLSHDIIHDALSASSYNFHEDFPSEANENYQDIKIEVGIDQSSTS